MDFSTIRSQIAKDKNKLEHEINGLKTYTRSESYDTLVAGEILLLLLEGKDVSEEQLTFLKKQTIDFTKVLAIIGLQAVPGSSIAIIALEKIGRKYGIDIIPKPTAPPIMK